MEKKTTVAKDRATETKKILEEQKQVSFIVPIGENEKEGAIETVQINGYKMEIKKGELVTLPKSVVDLLSEKYRINMIAGRNAKINSRPDKMTAL